ncbi:MAG: BACON domain-containing protein [Alistipes sp.]|nr:BACON domain-containing protein [Alistipes sp.]
MDKTTLYRIAVGITILLPFLTLGSCNTDDVNIDGTGIVSDSMVIHLDYNGRSNSFIITSLYPWEAFYEYPKDASWITVDPMEAGRWSTVTLTAEPNPYRRRSTYVTFDNGHREVSVNVIQRAESDYEPGTIILSMNMGMTDVESPVPVGEYTSWMSTGAGSGSAQYSGTDAIVQADVTSYHPGKFSDGAYPDASMGNNVEVAPGGDFTVSRIGMSAYDRVILTLYVASPEGGGWADDPSAGLTVEGGTLENKFMDIAFEVIELPEYNGWQMVVAEFRKIAGQDHFNLRFTNNGARNLYIDDILLESAGRGTQVIGTAVPNVTTLAAAGVTSTTATLRGRYTLPESIAAVDEVGIEYKLNTDADYTAHPVTDPGAGNEFEITITGLAEGEIYFYRAYARVEENTSRGEDLVVTIGDWEEPDPDEGDEEE